MPPPVIASSSPGRDSLLPRQRLFHHGRSQAHYELCCAPRPAVSGMSGPPDRLHECVMVRDARPEEFASIGALRVAAYRADGFLPDSSSYAATLRALGADGSGEILAAVDEADIPGTGML